MALDFTEFFEKYEALVAEVDKVFETVRSQHEDKVACKVGCSDCCHALFDLSLIEALYLNHHFNGTFESKERYQIQMRADEAERTQHKLIRKAVKAKEKGASSAEVLTELAKVRIRCPLLGEEDKCVLYDRRPITCRLYGIPTAFEGQPRTCGLSGFEPGQAYPTVNLEKIQDRLVALSAEVAEAVKTRYTGLATTFVPVSVALLNQYDEEYLGVMDAKEQMHRDLIREDIVREFNVQAQVDGACTDCESEDCSSCPQAAAGGCKGQPTIIEIGGPTND